MPRAPSVDDRSQSRGFRHKVLFSQHILRHYEWQLEPNSSGRWPKPYFNIEAWQGPDVAPFLRLITSNLYHLFHPWPLLKVIA